MHRHVCVITFVLVCVYIILLMLCADVIFVCFAMYLHNVLVADHLARHVCVNAFVLVCVMYILVWCVQYVYLFGVCLSMLIMVCADVIIASFTMYLLMRVCFESDSAWYLCSSLQ